MEKRSKHPGDVAKWIEKVFDSCTNVNQLLVAERLSRNFSASVGYSSTYTLYLNAVSEMTWNKLISNKK